MTDLLDPKIFVQSEATTALQAIMNVLAARSPLAKRQGLEKLSVHLTRLPNALGINFGYPQRGRLLQEFNDADGPGMSSAVWPSQELALESLTEKLQEKAPNAVAASARISSYDLCVEDSTRLIALINANYAALDEAGKEAVREALTEPTAAHAITKEKLTYDLAVALEAWAKGIEKNYESAHHIGTQAALVAILHKIKPENLEQLTTPETASIGRQFGAERQLASQLGSLKTVLTDWLNDPRQASVAQTEADFAASTLAEAGNSMAKQIGKGIGAVVTQMTRRLDALLQAGAERAA